MQEVLKDERTHDAQQCERFAPLVGQERLAAWIPGSAGLTVVGTIVTITVESSFLRDLVQSNIGAELKTAARQLLGSEACVEYRVADPAMTDVAPATKQSAPIKLAAANLPVAEPAVPAPQSSTEAQDATFDNFVTGDHNRFASEVSRQIALRGMAASIVLLTGPCGSGKSHLLAAIRRDYRRRFPQSRSVLLTAEQFTTGFVDALRGGGLPSFRQKHRGVELLLVDDLAFFVGKRATIEELLYTIDQVIAHGGQVVIASNRRPSDLGQLGGELMSRLASALVCELGLPDFEARRELLARLFARHQVAIADIVLDLLAKGLATGVRELMGVVNRLATQHRLLGDAIDMTLASKIVGQANRHTRRPVHLDDVDRVVCDFFGVDSRKLRSDDRHKSVSEPRMVAMWLARKYTQSAWREIGAYFGGRSHSTVISAHRRIEKQIDGGSQLRIAGQAWGLDEAIQRLESALLTA